ncbi:MAG: hypothetical protein WCS70_11530 [Verrucomicrobiota bacterium]
MALNVSSVTAAPYTDSFNALIAELNARAATLSNSVDKTEQKQYKTILKTLAALNKPTDDLGDDIKSAGKIAKSLAKAFPNEFTSVATLSVLTQTNLATLVDGVFSNLTNEVQGSLNDLAAAIAALPPGSAKDNAQAAYDDAVALLNQGAADFSAFSKILASTLKAIVKGIAASQATGGGGGGGGGGGAGVQCKIDGANFNSLVDVNIYVNLTGELSISGSTLQRSVTIIAENVTAPGNYAATGGQVIEIGTGVAHSTLISGTVHIATFNLAQQKATGSFTFSSSQSSPVQDTNSIVNVTNGSFNISAITQF